MLPRVRSFCSVRVATAAAAGGVVGLLGVGGSSFWRWRATAGHLQSNRAATSGGVVDGSSSAMRTGVGEDAMEPRVTSIHRYPVKSCGGEQLSTVQCQRLQPLPGDRRYMFVDSENKFITQRPREPRQGNGGLGVPAMATIQASYQPNGMLRLAAPPQSQYLGLEPLEIPSGPPPASLPRLVCTLFSGKAKVTEQPASAGLWFSTFSGVVGAQLVRADETANTSADDWRESRAAFQAVVFAGEESAEREIPLDDGGTILLVSAAALRKLNEKLVEKGMTKVTMDRFRPNFVVDGVEAHAEDEWLEVQLGEVQSSANTLIVSCKPYSNERHYIH